MAKTDEEILERYKARIKRQNKAIKEKYDRVSATLPQGTIDRIKALGLSINGAINDSLLAYLDCLEESGEERPEPNRIEEKKTDPPEKSKDLSSVDHAPLDLSELQARLDAKKAEQDRKAEELEQARKAEKDREGKELVERIKWLRDRSKEKGENTEFRDLSDAEITRIYQDPELMEALKDPEGKEEFIKKFGVNNYEKVREYINNIERCRDEI